jgi:hypothetical protein
MEKRTAPVEARSLMSKHVSRKKRWAQESPTRYISSVGAVVYQQNAWYGVLEYRTRSPEPGSLPVWVPRRERLGPFKRPRDAMVAVEREVTILKNRHGQDMLLPGQLWAEA